MIEMLDKMMDRLLDICSGRDGVPSHRPRHGGY